MKMMAVDQNKMNNNKFDDDEDDEEKKKWNLWTILVKIIKTDHK